MDINVNTWNKQQYHAFILVCGAQSNLAMSETEHRYISELVGEDNYRFAMDNYAKCSDYQCIETISEGRKLFYPSEHDKEQLESELKTLFAADHDYAILEDNFLRYIDKVL
jgi:hypothetical protein